jgi:hypothetical protein
MAVLKLADDFDVPYALLGIQSGNEDYWLAFHLNRRLDLRLRRLRTDCRVEGIGDIPKFEYDDDHNYVKWILVPNRIHESPEQGTDYALGLFQNHQLRSTRYLIEEFPNIDYFLRIESEEEGIDARTKSRLQGLQGVRWVGSIDPDKLKIKDVIIF